MADIANHPIVRRVIEAGRGEAARPRPVPAIDSEELVRLCLEAGADDAGLVAVDRPEVAGEREEIESVFPRARTLVSYVLRMNPESIRSPARSVANLEFHHAGEEVNEVGRRLSRALRERGIRALPVSMGFPMEMSRWPGKIWTVSHKTVAVAAGLGKMGIHRNVIHPRFGNFILLGTVVTEAEVEADARPLDYNPCLECKLCVAACPTGAIGSDGSFNFSACYTHNYREFMGGFTDWVENVADSGTREDYRRRVSDPETVSVWQSLGFGPNYKAAYCLSVCPAGEEVISPFLADKAGWLRDWVKPLQEKEEIVYVVKGADAEGHVRKRFRKKTTKVVGNGLNPVSIGDFLFGLRLVFQPGAARDLDATYHFTFSGEEPREATVAIRSGTLEVRDGHQGAPDLRLRADSRTWLRLLAREVGLVRALLTGGIRFRGSPRLLLAFARCFPS